MKKFLKIFFLFFILSQSGYAQNFKIEKILDLKDPWSLTFINKDEVLITEKEGEILLANIKNWLPEIYQIGIRNPQGMTLSPLNGKIYISNHGAKGGDFFGEVKFGENYGWQIWCWGGVNYSGTKCGETEQWDRRFTKPLYTWSPSIAVSAVQIYKGDEFKEWNGHILMTSLKDETIRKLEFINDNEVGREVIILKGKLNRIRDLKIAEDGKIYILSNGAGALSVINK
jgi:quinoprotein glucose dehydrogenase